ncbi:thermostable hemolysin [Pseudomonas resinovorans]|uniref:Thermostable hemolysin n=1 Tax=Metapseudomonas resinovorans TaxID=53412 RepID=A0ABT4Y566_METRE|nr:thermostable hemolysin [Pseudomonas resinovorans]MDA8484010.1 thermostable hemolysin [Pseudomonas resinovorans]
MNSVEWNALFPFRFGHKSQQHYLSLLLAGDTGRVQVEDFVHRRFLSAHGADIHQYMPELLSMRNFHGALSAVAGIRLAEQETLFLEQYLEAPVESRIASLTGLPVERRQVVEVGNLASISAGNARLIIVAVTWLLHQRGLEWVVFTGAPGLINSFHRLGLEPLHLGEANPSRLGHDQEQWGSYYEQKPQVFTGNIHFGYEQLQRNGVIARLGFPEVDEAAHHAA